MGFRNYAPTGAGVRDTVLVLGGDGTGTPWNGVGPEELSKLFIKSVALDGSDYSKLVLKSELGTSYFELSEEVVGVTKGVFINLGDLATAGNAYVQLREIEYTSENGNRKSWMLASEPSDEGDLVQIDAITAWRIDSTSGEVQIKTRKVYVSKADAESGWTKVDDTEESQKISCVAPGS